MGMFDSIIAFCPTCGKELEFQSKAGKCGLNRYSMSSVPAEIAKDLLGHDYDDKPYNLVNCCGKDFKLSTTRISRVSVFLVEWKEDEEQE